MQNNNPQTYIKEVRESDLEKPEDVDIIKKILKDFSPNNQEIT